MSTQAAARSAKVCALVSASCSISARASLMRSWSSSPARSKADSPSRIRAIAFCRQVSRALVIFSNASAHALLLSVHRSADFASHSRRRSIKDCSARSHAASPRLNCALNSSSQSAPATERSPVPASAAAIRVVSASIASSQAFPVSSAMSLAYSLAVSASLFLRTLQLSESRLATK